MSIALLHQALGITANAWPERMLRQHYKCSHVSVCEPPQSGLNENQALKRNPRLFKCGVGGTTAMLMICFCLHPTNTCMPTAAGNTLVVKSTVRDSVKRSSEVKFASTHV